MFEGGDPPLAETETPRTCDLFCEGENTVLGFRGKACERGSPGREGGDGSRWQWGAMGDAAVPTLPTAHLHNPLAEAANDMRGLI